MTKEKQKRCLGEHQHLMEVAGHKHKWCGTCTFWETEKEHQARIKKDGTQGDAK